MIDLIIYYFYIKNLFVYLSYSQLFWCFGSHCTNTENHNGLRIIWCIFIYKSKQMHKVHAYKSTIVVWVRHGHGHGHGYRLDLNGWNQYYWIRVIFVHLVGYLLLQVYRAAYLVLLGLITGIMEVLLPFWHFYTFFEVLYSHWFFKMLYYSFDAFKPGFVFLMMVPTLDCWSGSNKISHLLEQ